MRSQVLYAAVIAVVLVDFALGLYAALEAPFPLDAPVGTPTAYRNIYIHIPLAWSSYILYTGAFVSALLYLVRGGERWDRYTRAFITLGTVYAVFTLVSGMAWASESWGKAWSWDPRETAVLLLLLAYLVYFVLRGSIPDPDRAATLSAAYAVAAYSMVPLSFLAPRLMESLHPTSQDFGKFMANPEVMRIFGPKVLLATIASLLLARLAAGRLAGEKPPRWLPAAGAALIVLGVAGGLLVAKPYLGGGVARVAAAQLSDGGRIAELTLVYPDGSEKNITFNPPVESPVKPPVRVKQGNITEPSIVKHLVVVDGGRIEVVTHWSVALNLAAYMVATGVVLIMLGRSGARKG